MVSMIYVIPIVKSDVEDLVNSHVVIWTTTPWTIPGNQAIAFGQNINYVLIDADIIDDDVKDKKINYFKKFIRSGYC